MKLNRRQFFKRAGAMAAGAAAVAIVGVPETAPRQAAKSNTVMYGLHDGEVLRIDGLFVDQSVTNCRVELLDGAQVYGCTFDHCAIAPIDPKADITLVDNYFTSTSPVTWKV